MTLRLYCKADLAPDNTESPLLRPLFPEFPGTRQIFRLNVESVATSCGWSVPAVGEMQERSEFRDWAGSKGEDGMEAYRLANNVVNIDGLPTGYVSDGVPSRESVTLTSPACHDRPSQRILQNSQHTTRAC